MSARIRQARQALATLLPDWVEAAGSGAQCYKSPVEIRLVPMRNGWRCDVYSQSILIAVWADCSPDADPEDVARKGLDDARNFLTLSLDTLPKVTP